MGLIVECVEITALALELVLPVTLRFILPFECKLDALETALVEKYPPVSTLEVDEQPENSKTPEIVKRVKRRDFIEFSPAFFYLTMKDGFTQLRFSFSKSKKRGEPKPTPLLGIIKMRM